MRACSSFLRVAAEALSIIAIVLCTGCSADVDGNLGYNMVPEDQKMVMRHLTFKGGQAIEYDEENSTDTHSVYIKKPGQFFTTSLYRTDSLRSVNISYGYLGVERNDTFGMRRASFASTITFMNTLPDDDGFGYKPIFDTMKLFLTVDSHGVDTLTPVTYNVYEIKKPLLGSVIKAADTTAYINCDFLSSGAYDPSKKLFTFKFPDPDKKVGPSSNAVVLTPVDMSPTGATWDFIRRLMLIPDNYQSPDWNGYARDTAGLYKDESLWVKNFYGVLIEPETASSPENARGSLYSLELDASGLYMIGRRRNPDDPTIVKDTVGMYYYFKDLTTEDNMSVNRIQHNYNVSLTDSQPSLLASVKMEGIDASGNAIPRSERTPVDIGVVEGAGGPATEIYFTDDFINVIKDIAEEVDYNWRTIGVNFCGIRFYVPGGKYDWTENQSNLEAILPYLNSSITRLGIYQNMNNLVNIIDYLYSYESSNNTIDYGGYLNRARCCYEMDISGYMQQLIKYVISLRNPDGTYNAFDENVQSRTIYLGPEALYPYTLGRSVIQGMEGSNESPIHIEMTYTLIR